MDRSAAAVPGPDSSAQLILSLYEPGQTPAAIARTQETLQQLQRSPQGWQLAKTLLDRTVAVPSDVYLKFFGALTIVIKLNTERQAVPPHQTTPPPKKKHQTRPLLTLRQPRLV